MVEIIKSVTFLFVLLNPFLIIIYLIDLVQKYDFKKYIITLTKASLIAIIVFSIFAIVGDSIFTDIVHANFASFQIFGGIIFLFIGIQFVFKGNNAITLLRGDSTNPTGSIAMPILIGPGTISASVVIGQNHDNAVSAVIIACAVILSVIIMIILKFIHDKVKRGKEYLVEGYIEVAGRITALYVGTMSIEMIMQGVSKWLESGLVIA